VHEDDEQVRSATGTHLKSDCERCFGLCCVALPFAKSADFPVSKVEGQPCVNLAADFRCGIHDRLREHGYHGCTAFECFGAGQQVSQVTFAGRDWRQEPGIASQMFGAFAVMRQLHEILRYLDEALKRQAARPVWGDLGAAADEVRQLTGGSARQLRDADISAIRSTVSPLLVQASALARAGLPRCGVSHRGADLIGAKLRGTVLYGADMRGARLIAADLRGADLRGADLLGVDLRGADLRGADLRDSLFLTEPQVNAAKGDAHTRLPSTLVHPAHWATLQAAPGRAG
jgi:hypothetical protein